MKCPICCLWIRVIVLGLALGAVAAETPAPVAVKLTGITTLFGDKRALLLVQEPTQPGQAPKPDQSCILSEGQRQGPIEVVSVDEQKGRVMIKNNGKEMELSLAKDGLSLPTAPSTPPTTPASVPTATPAFSQPAAQGSLASANNFSPVPSANSSPANSERVVIGANSRRRNPPAYSGGLIAPNAQPGANRLAGPWWGGQRAPANPGPVNPAPVNPSPVKAADPAPVQDSPAAVLARVPIPPGSFDFLKPPVMNTFVPPPPPPAPYTPPQLPFGYPYERRWGGAVMWGPTEFDPR